MFTTHTVTVFRVTHRQSCHGHTRQELAAAPGQPGDLHGGDRGGAVLEARPHDLQVLQCAGAPAESETIKKIFWNVTGPSMTLKGHQRLGHYFFSSDKFL